LALFRDDSRVAEQPLDVAGVEPPNRLDVEGAKGLAEVLPLAQDREPAEAGLEALEAEPLVQPALVADGAAPLLVVVGVVPLVGRLPAAFYATSTLTTPSSTTTGYVSTGS
jgi:hypothetical protein